MFHPVILQPIPSPHFVGDLRAIDPALQVVWGYSRYMLNRWVIERKLSPESYHAHYRSLIEGNEERFVEQPIFDSDQPILDRGEVVGYEQVGTRKFDLAPEWECVMIVEEKDRGYRPLDQRTLTELRRVYAWNRFHSLTRMRYEKEAAAKEAEAKRREAFIDDVAEAIIDRKNEIWNLPFSGQPKTVLKGTNLE